MADSFSDTLQAALLEVEGLSGSIADMQYEYLAGWADSPGGSLADMQTFFELPVGPFLSVPLPEEPV